MTAPTVAEPDSWVMEDAAFADADRRTARRKAQWHYLDDLTDSMSATRPKRPNPFHQDHWGYNVAGDVLAYLCRQHKEVAAEILAHLEMTADQIGNTSDEFGTGLMDDVTEIMRKREDGAQ
jgi:hypothetical protein